MLTEASIRGLIRNGGVFKDVEGSTPKEVFENLCAMADLPDCFDKKNLVEELSEREKILSTAVGNGIAIPHPRKSLVDEDANQLMMVCYLKTPIAMSAPDERKVSVMFVLLTKSSQFHLQTLSNLARLIHDDSFRKFLDTKPDAESLIEKISATLQKK